MNDNFNNNDERVWWNRPEPEKPGEQPETLSPASAPEPERAPGEDVAPVEVQAPPKQTPPENKEALAKEPDDADAPRQDSQPKSGDYPGEWPPANGGPYNGEPPYSQGYNNRNESGWNQPPRYSPPQNGGYRPNGGWQAPQQRPPYRPPYQQGPYNPQGQYNPPGNTPQNNYGGNWAPPPGTQYNGGQTPRDDEPYKWDFNDYQNADAKAPGYKPKKGKGPAVFLWALAIVAVLGVALFAGYGIYSTLNSAVLPGDAAESSSDMVDIPGLIIRDKPEDADTDQIMPEGKLTTSQVYKKVAPSVVGIATYINNNSFTPMGEGSGIVMTGDGYILTNAHVVDGAAGITVTLYNGETYAAQIIGADSKTDLAVIKVEAQNLTAAEFGNSSQLEVGEDVVAIGNPTGITLASSMTKGIISALNREVSDSSYSAAFIQTDAAINPGNSGGALVNQYGQVIGINSAKLADIDYEGIGFAIPVDDALPIAEELITYGRVTGRAELGLTGQMVDETLARFNGTPSGIGVVTVKPNSDLAAKGVVPGDIITQVDGQNIQSFRTLTDVIAKKRPGDTIRLTIYRRKAGSTGGSTFEVTVSLMEEE